MTTEVQLRGIRRVAALIFAVLAIVFAGSLAGPSNISSASSAVAAFSIQSRIPLAYQVGGIALNHLTHRLFVVDQDDSLLVVFNTDTQEVVAKVPIGADAYSVAVNETTDIAYVVNAPNGPRSTASLSVVDGANYTLVTTVELESPGNLAINELTNTIYITNPESWRITLFNGGTNLVTKTVYLNMQSTGVAVDPVTNTVFVADHFQGNPQLIEALDGTTGTVKRSAAITENYQPSVIAFDSANNTLYVAHKGNQDGRDPLITLYDASTLERTGSIRLPNWAGNQIAVDPITNLVYFTSGEQGLGGLTVVDGATNSIVTTVDAAAYPAAVAADPSTGTVYFTNEFSPDVLNIVSGTNLAWNGPLQPVFRFWSPTLQVHFYTISAVERAGILANYPSAIWTDEGVGFEAYPVHAVGTVPVYRFWSPKLGDHFYTTDSAERDFIQANYDASTWRYEGIAYYAYPLKTSIGGTVPVARFWSPTLRNHFYTPSSAERDAIIANYQRRIWTYEGDAFNVPSP